jgi:hypothetical protein
LPDARVTPASVVAKTARGAALGLAIALAPGTAAAQGATPRDDGWHFTLTSYMWASGMSGSVALPRQSRDFDADFGDILSSMQFGAMGFFEMRRGGFGIVVDGLTLTTEQDVTTPRGIAFRGGSSRMTATEVSVLSLARVVETPGWSLDVGAGARAWWLDTKLSLNASLAPARSASESVNFVDPILAVRAGVPLTDRISLTAYADIGGFNTGSQSTWQVLTAFNWQVTDSIAAHFGYRHMAVSVARGPVDMDITISGPILGASFRF